MVDTSSSFPEISAWLLDAALELLDSHQVPPWPQGRSSLPGGSGSGLQSCLKGQGRGVRAAARPPAGVTWADDVEEGSSGDEGAMGAGGSQPPAAGCVHPRGEIQHDGQSASCCCDSCGAVKLVGALVWAGGPEAAKSVIARLMDRLAAPGEFVMILSRLSPSVAPNALRPTLHDVLSTIPINTCLHVCYFT